jgi:release factor glutamine methyltransferase
VSVLAFSPDETRAEALRRVQGHFSELGLEKPHQEARWLFCMALGLSRAALLSGQHEPLGAHATRLGEWVERRARREPLSRIEGGRDFHGRWFETSPAVLDPRPETELLVEAALAALRAAGHSQPRLLDIGTGCGAIIVSLLAEWGEAHGVAVDISAEALDIARRNSEAHGVADRLILLRGDLFAPVTGLFDLVVSNPPYIPSADLAALEPEVRYFDPALALDGGADGLAFYRRIIAGAPHHLLAGGFLALELGIHQAQAVSALARQAGFSDIRLHHDLAGIERHLTARWKNR